VGEGGRRCSQSWSSNPFNSMIQLAERSNVELVKTGFRCTGTINENLGEHIGFQRKEGADELSRLLLSTNVAYISDLVNVDEVGNRRWAVMDGKFNDISAFLPARIPKGMTVLRSGMIHEEMVNGKVFVEYVGRFSGEEKGEERVCVIVYKPVAWLCSKCRKGTCKSEHKGWFAEASEMRGAGTNETRAVSEMLSLSRRNVLVERGYDGKLLRRLVREIGTTRKDGYCLGIKEKESEWSRTTRHLIEFDADSVTTDGGFEEGGSTVDKLLCRLSVPKASASMVLVNHEKREVQGIRLVGIGMDMEAHSGYDAELLGIAMSTDVRSRRGEKSIPAFSDCESAINVSNKFWEDRKRIKDERWSLIRFITERSRTLQPVKWVKGHPERGKEKDRKKWNDEQIQIYLADCVASGHEVHAEVAYRMRVITVHCKVFLQHIMSVPGRYVWTDKSTGLPINQTLMSIVERENMNAYRRERDAFRLKVDLERGQRIRDPKWVEATIDFAMKMFNMGKLGTRKSVTAMRHIFDRYQHGGNTAKDAKRAIPDMCPACGLYDSVEHYSRGCKYEAIEYVRQSYLRKMHGLVVDVMKKDVRVGQLAERVRDLALNIPFSGDIERGASLWVGVVTKSDEAALEVLLGEERYFKTEKGEREAIKVIRQICSILAKATTKVWNTRCRIFGKQDGGVGSTSGGGDRITRYLVKVDSVGGESGKKTKKGRNARKKERSKSKKAEQIFVEERRDEGREKRGCVFEERRGRARESGSNKRGEREAAQGKVGVESHEWKCGGDGSDGSSPMDREEWVDSDEQIGRSRLEYERESEKRRKAGLEAWGGAVSYGGWEESERIYAKWCEECRENERCIVGEVIEIGEEGERVNGIDERRGFRYGSERGFESRVERSLQQRRVGSGKMRRRKGLS
jgi:hypothetical protein